MKSEYMPEIGHSLFFDSNIKRFDCPNYIVALLRDLDRKLCIVMWNNNQEEFDSPFGNTGNTFKNDTFEVQAFNWNDDIEQEYNFKYKDIEISWYKYLGRDMSINKQLTYEEAIEMYNECLNSIKDMEEDND